MDVLELASKVDVLSSRIEEVFALANRTEQSKATNPQPTSRQPVWEVTERTSGGTYTPGTDWQPQFEEGGVSYVRYGIPTVHGELRALHTASSNPAMCVLNFDSPAPRDVPCYIGGENFGVLQVKVNSQVTTEYVAAQALTLQVREGSNTIVFMTDGVTDRIDLRGGFF